MLDISEEPRWGRVAESFGEAPVLASRLAAAATQGFQGDDPSQPDRIGACAKHFVGYGLSAGGRDYDTVSVGENTLRNLHLRPFRAAVESGVLSVMAAFNDVDGTPDARPPAPPARRAQGRVGLRRRRRRRLERHRPDRLRQGVAEDDREAARLAIEAGVDLDMVQRRLPRAPRRPGPRRRGRRGARRRRVPPRAPDEVPARPLRRRRRTGQPSGRQRTDRGEPGAGPAGGASRRTSSSRTTVSSRSTPTTRRCCSPAASSTRATCCSAPGCSTVGPRRSSPRPPA